jgi:hypothetical protein
VVPTKAEQQQEEQEKEEEEVEQEQEEVPAACPRWGAVQAESS